MIFPGKKRREEYRCGKAAGRQGSIRGRQGGLLIVWVCIHTLCILVALTEGDCACGYMVMVWGDLFEELMYALHKLCFEHSFYYLKKKNQLSIFVYHTASHVYCPTKTPKTDALFFRSHQYLDLPGDNNNNIILILILFDPIVKTCYSTPLGNTCAKTSGKFLLFYGSAIYTFCHKYDEYLANRERCYNSFSILLLSCIQLFNNEWYKNTLNFRQVSTTEHCIYRFDCSSFMNDKEVDMLCT